MKPIGSDALSGWAVYVATGAVILIAFYANHWSDYALLGIVAFLMFVIAKAD